MCNVCVTSFNLTSTYVVHVHIKTEIKIDNTIFVFKNFMSKFVVNFYQEVYLEELSRFSVSK